MIRPVVVGFIAVAALSGIAYFNDQVLKQTRLIGDHLPISVFGGLILFLVTVNVLLHKFRNRWALSGSELAVAMSLVLVACSIPSGGLMGAFPSTLVFPHHFARSEPGWKEQKIVENAPPKMLVDVQGKESEVLNAYMQGMAIGEKHISLSDIPWFAWSRTLAFWIPFLITIWAGIMGLSLMVHRQWADHEQLPYPIAKFASALLPKSGSPVGDVFGNRLFWIGVGVVCGIHLINYAYEYFPDSIQIPLAFDFSPMASLSETFHKGGGGGLLRFKLFFSAIGISYFIASDVSFSLGIGPFLYAFIGGMFRNYGIQLGRGSYGGSFWLPSPYRLSTFGGYLGIFIFLAYNGRHHYRKAISALFSWNTGPDQPAESVWGARIFLASLLATIGYLLSVGLGWALATVFALTIFMMLLVQARVVAETGLYFFHPAFPPIFLAFFGAQAVGVEALVPIYLIAAILMTSGTTREALMPYVLNSFKILDGYRVRSTRVMPFLGIALLLALAISLPATLYWQYDRGQSAMHGQSKRVPRSLFNAALTVKERLDTQGIDKPARMTTWERLSRVSPDMRSMAGFVVGLGGALLLNFARLRIPGWPLHPLIFLTWRMWSSYVMAVSFLIGWLLKKVITQYGGETAYQRFKPLMFGLIAGDMLGGIAPAVIGFVYYFATGELPRPFMVTPG